MSEAGNSDRITREYLDSLFIETRYIGAKKASTELSLFGETFQTPIMTAALSHLHGICDHAMAQMAQGARDAGALHWVGMGEDSELEEILETKAHTVKVIKPHADSAEVFRKIKHAIAYGVFAVGMDIDHAFAGNGQYDEVFGLPMRPVSQEMLVEYVKAAQQVPFIVKGVLSVADAVRSAEAGASGIVLSHHHNMMEFSVPPLMVLPRIRKELGDEYPIFVDCGIVSGMDAYKALALGATAVSVGRELMGPLKNGSHSVTERIQQMTGELASVMARTGKRTLEEIESSVIWKKDY